MTPAEYAQEILSLNQGLAGSGNVANYSLSLIEEILEYENADGYNEEVLEIGDIFAFIVLILDNQESLVYWNTLLALEPLLPFRSNYLAKIVKNFRNFFRGKCQIDCVNLVCFAVDILGALGGNERLGVRFSLVAEANLRKLHKRQQDGTLQTLDRSKTYDS